MSAKRLLFLLPTSLLVTVSYWLYQSLGRQLVLSQPPPLSLPSLLQLLEGEVTLFHPCHALYSVQQLTLSALGASV